jgi:hypothetical protein
MTARPVPPAGRSKKRIVIGVLGALTAAGCLELARAAGSSDSSTDGAAPAGLVAARAAPLSVESGLASSRLSALERRIRELEARESNAAPDAKPAGATDEEMVPSPALDPDEVAARSSRKIAGVEQALRAEPVDATWSRDTVSTLQRVFNESELRGSSLERVECGSTICALVARHDDSTASADFERFGLAVPDMGAALIHRAAPDGTLETVAYFIRQGHESPDHPVRKSY